MYLKGQKSLSLLSLVSQFGFDRLCSWCHFWEPCQSPGHKDFSCFLLEFYIYTLPTCCYGPRVRREVSSAVHCVLCVVRDCLRWPVVPTPLTGRLSLLQNLELLLCLCQNSVDLICEGPFRNSSVPLIHASVSLSVPPYLDYVALLWILNKIR